MADILPKLNDAYSGQGELSADDLMDTVKEIERLRAEAKGPKIDPKSWFYRNCKNQRRHGAKICGSCPFRAYIEFFEESHLLK